MSGETLIRGRLAQGRQCLQEARFGTRITGLAAAEVPYLFLPLNPFKKAEES